MKYVIKFSCLPIFIRYCVMAYRLFPFPFVRTASKTLTNLSDISHYYSFEIASSDHTIISAKIRQSLWINEQQTIKTTCYDRSSHNNRYIAKLKKKKKNQKEKKLSLPLRIIFNMILEKSKRHTPNNKYENFISALIQAAEQCLPRKPNVEIH